MMSRRVALLVAKLVIVGALLSVPAFAASKTDLAPQPLESMDGVSWSGLTFGTTTAADMRKTFNTARGSFQYSIELRQPHGAPMHVEALLDSRAKDARLKEIYITYRDQMPELAAVAAASNEPEKDFYLQGRFEDWRLATFPQKGIVAFVLRVGEQDTVPMVILAPPDAVSTVCQRLSSTLAPVVVRQDPHEGEEKVMEFGTADATFTLDRVKVDDVDGKEATIENEMMRATAGGAIRYRTGAAGSYTTAIDASWNARRGGTCSVKCEIRGFGPYGEITADGAGSSDLPAANSNDHPTKDYEGPLHYRAALRKAMSDAEASFHDQMEAQGPPPLQQVRAQQWNDLVEEFRFPKAPPEQLLSRGGAP